MLYTSAFSNQLAVISQITCSGRADAALDKSVDCMARKNVRNADRDARALLSHACLWARERLACCSVLISVTAGTFPYVHLSR